MPTWRTSEGLLQKALISLVTLNTYYCKSIKQDFADVISYCICIRECKTQSAAGIMVFKYDKYLVIIMQFYKA